MKRHPVKSSAVTAIGFHDGVLEVEYASGAVYRMEGITSEQARNLRRAKSIGKALNALKGSATNVWKQVDEK